MIGVTTVVDGNCDAGGMTGVTTVFVDNGKCLDGVECVVVA